MHLDSLSNNIPNQEHATSASSIQSKTKSGVFSSDLGSLKVISEQVEAISASQILHTGNVIEESSKSLRGASTLQDHIGDESINPDSNLEEVSDFQESEDLDLDDEDLFNEILEEEELDNIYEEKVDIEEEKIDVEKEIANVEQVLIKKEREIENQIINEVGQLDQDMKINYIEGPEKVVIDEGTATEIEDTDISLNNDIIETFDSKIEQNEQTISQNQRVITEDKEKKGLFQGAIQKKSVGIAKDTGVIRKDAAMIAKGMKTRAENAKKLNELDADKRVDAETVNEAINRRLQSAAFDNVRNAKGVLLRDDKDGVEELKQGIEDDRQAHPEKALTECVEDGINEWFENKVICELDERENLVPISPERRSQLAAILSRGVIKDIGFQVGIAQKTAEKNKAEERTTESLKAASRDEHESIVYLVDGQHLDPQFVSTMYKVVECKLFCLDGVEIKNVNRLEEMNKENIDLTQRITEMVILKDIIKRDILKTELEHTENEHTTTVIDGVKRSILNKIYRFEGQDKENVCLRHPTLHPKVKSL